MQVKGTFICQTIYEKVVGEHFHITRKRGRYYQKRTFRKTN